MSSGEPVACFRCGTCCIAPDISTLGKPVNAPCVHLRPDHTCGIYPDRPPICRSYRPDDLCQLLHNLPPNERVSYYLYLFGLLSEAPAADSAPLE